jgi:hypothetical protein
VSDFAVKAQYRIGKRGLVNADFRRRHPLFAESSIFSTFSFEPTQQGRIGLQWRLKRDIQIFSQYTLFHIEEDPSHGIEITVGNRCLRVGYSQSGGYGGDLSGITCWARRRFFHRLELSGSGRLGWYSRATDIDENQINSAIRIGSKYWIKEIWSLGVCGEHLTGRRYSSDVRILVTTTFAVKAGT